MSPIKNANGKLVCQVDKSTRTVEIVHKGFKTLISFLAEDKIKIVNIKPVA